MAWHKKLLICSPSHAIHGGVETIINDICRELPKRGWEVLLGLGKGSHFNNVEAYKTAYPDLPITAIDGTKGTRQSRLEALNGLIRKVGPDIVLSARIFDSYEAVAHLKKQFSGVPRFAVAIRGYESPYIYDAGIFKNIIDLCVVDGNLLAATVINWSGIAPDKVMSIPGGIQPPEREVLPRNSSGILKIGYVGRISQGDKRVLDIVPLIERLCEEGIDFNFEIIGTGPDEGILRNKLRSLVLNGKVTLSGWKRHEELYRDIYPVLDCVVNFSPTEGTTIAPREAMVNGVVPVISEFTGLKAEGQFANEVNSLTFPVGDIEKAVFNIKRLVTELGLLSRLSANAMKSQAGKYSFQGSMDAWAEALNRCLEMPPSRGPLPKLNFPADGRLARMRIPPWLAQRIRHFSGRKHIHSDPGSEWPTASGLMTPDAETEIMRFASEYEQGLG